MFLQRMNNMKAKIWMIIIIGILLFVMMSSCSTTKNYDIRINEVGIASFWSKIKPQFDAKDIYITDIKSTGLELVLTLSDDNYIIKEIDLEVAYNDNSETQYFRVYGDCDKTEIHELGKLNELPISIYRADDVIQLVNKLDFGDIMLNKMNDSICRVEYKGFIKKNVVEKKYKTDNSKRNIYDFDGEEMIYDYFENDISDDIFFLVLILNYIDKESDISNNTGSFIELFIAMRKK